MLLHAMAVESAAVFPKKSTLLPNSLTKSVSFHSSSSASKRTRRSSYEGGSAEKAAKGERAARAAHDPVHHRTQSSRFSNHQLNRDRERSGSHLHIVLLKGLVAVPPKGLGDGGGLR